MLCGFYSLNTQIKGAVWYFIFCPRHGLQSFTCSDLCLPQLHLATSVLYSVEPFPKLARLSYIHTCAWIGLSVWSILPSSGWPLFLLHVSEILEIMPSGRSSLRPPQVPVRYPPHLFPSGPFPVVAGCTHLCVYVSNWLWVSRRTGTGPSG